MANSRLGRTAAVASLLVGACASSPVLDASTDESKGPATVQTASSNVVTTRPAQSMTSVEDLSTVVEDPAATNPTAPAPATTATPTTETTPTSTTLEVAAFESATLPPSPTQADFRYTISEITDTTAARLSYSWRPGCPVHTDELRLLSLSHWNFEGRPVTGELVVRVDVAESVVSVFHTLFTSRFPIERMELVDVFEGDDDRSMAANNTSAFNCREVAWKPGVWSNHAYGTAIDINPLRNPYVSDSQILPPEGAKFVDRSVETLGGIYRGDIVTRAFADIGWGWGGAWSSAKDWQHFSASGG